jgi:hypothetical protein
MINQIDPLNQFTWWSSLKHGGLLIAAARLAHYFSTEKPELSLYWAGRLRSAVQAQQDAQKLGAQAALLDTVLEGILQLPALEWKKASAVGADWGHRLITGENFKPRRLWLGSNGAVLPVFDDDVKQIGIGTGRRSIARVVEWLRKSQQKLALLTNGVQWRLIHTGPDYEAWCEWDIALWFEEGEPSDQVRALLHLLSPVALTPTKVGEPAPLIAAIQDTRKGQAELSANLGERVRLAVEHMIHSSSEVIDHLRAESVAVTPRDVYIAATRLVMRCVVVLFAEARELLPRALPVYNDSYSIQGLREQLDRMAGGRSVASLQGQVSAWPRLLSLFRLIYEGSFHESLPVLRYGGGLFQPGDAGSTDPILRALALFEHPRNEPSDHSIHNILEWLTRAWERVPQGRSTKLVLSSIDFSDLSTEYIGILYEGLLDFQLRQADKDRPIVFLNLGDQPALPFMQLDAMPVDEIAKLFDKFKVAEKKGESGDDDDDGTEGEPDDESPEQTSEDEAPLAQPGIEQDLPDTGDTSQDREQLRQRIHTWARRAAEAGKLVKKPKGKQTPDKQREYDEALDKAARTLVPRTIFPGEWYLVREGNTRKGSGTFYTRPQLAGPITRRALRELAYDGDVPRTPEEILALKVCDPACGSGSFLLAALRFLTDALVESLHHHKRLGPNPAGVIVRLADGHAATKSGDETIPKPLGDPDFNDYLRAYLRRHIVERCLYGVDLDQLAIELGRLALWIETMDPRLPFGFLDHKIKVGNALVGCWFDHFQDYPVMAWEREGGDATHERFVHHFREYAAKGKNAGEKKRKGDKWTFAIKEKRSLVRAEAAILRTSRTQQVFRFVEEQLTPAGAHDHLLGVFETLHRLPIHDADERRRVYEQQFGSGTAYHQLRQVFDTWCALWFWPGDLIGSAPMPADFLKPTAQAQQIVRSLRRKYRFFHWELEFPDVFIGPSSGFNAVIGNPPWDTVQPASKEFFSNFDPLYRSYGREEAKDRQVEYFTLSPGLETEWLAYNASFKALANWMKQVAEPFDEKDAFSADVARPSFCDPVHPFTRQGSGKPYTYRMFLEAAYALLGQGGHLAMLIPSGIYSDQGSGDLRTLFLEKARWSHLYAFQNERFIFDAVDHRFKIAFVHVEKGGIPAALATRFRLGPGDSPEIMELELDITRNDGYLLMSLERIKRFSPTTSAVLEARTQADLRILEKLYSNGVLLGDKSPNGWNIHYQQGEFNMTSKAKLFPPRWKWEEKGYRSDEYGHWLLGDWQPYAGPTSILKRRKGLILSADGGAALHLDDLLDLALPLYQGAMINQFDHCAAAYRKSEGKRGFKWIPIEGEVRRVEPQYLMARDSYRSSTKVIYGSKIALRDISASTNERTLITAVTPSRPCGHTLGLLGHSTSELIGLIPVLNSVVVDFATRARMVGSHLTLFVLEDLPTVPPRRGDSASVLTGLSKGLLMPNEVFAPAWLKLRSDQPWRREWAASRHERLRKRAVIEAVVATFFGLGLEDFRAVCSGCDYSRSAIASGTLTRSLDTKGFWRMEKSLDPELRLGVLAQVAFIMLNDMGLPAFLSQNDGEGWMLPETLRLSDYGLGHDDRSKEHQPVSSVLGPRFYPWQLEQSVEESWEECELHAEILAKLLPPPDSGKTADSESGDAVAVDLFGNPIETDLFGSPIYVKPRKR